MLVGKLVFDDEAVPSADPHDPCFIDAELRHGIRRLCSGLAPGGAGIHLRTRRRSGRVDLSGCRYAERDPGRQSWAIGATKRWSGGRLWLLVIANFFFTPIGVAFLLVDPNTWYFYVIWFISSMSSMFAFGGVFSTVQDLAPVKIRATAVAFLIFAQKPPGLGARPMGHGTPRGQLDLYRGPFDGSGRRLLEHPSLRHRSAQVQKGPGAHFWRNSEGIEVRVPTASATCRNPATVGSGQGQKPVAVPDICR